MVDMEDHTPMYNPPDLTIRVGQTIEWQNHGKVQHSVSDNPAYALDPHDAYFPSGAKSFDSGPIMPGKSYRHTFTVPGHYGYYCLSHEIDNMVGKITVLGPGDQMEAKAGTTDPTTPSHESNAASVDPPVGH